MNIDPQSRQRRGRAFGLALLLILPSVGLSLVAGAPPAHAAAGGGLVVRVTSESIIVSESDGSNPRPIPNSPGPPPCFNPQRPEFCGEPAVAGAADVSPDLGSVAYLTHNGDKVIVQSLSGGAPRTVVSGDFFGQTIRWSRDGRLLGVGGLTVGADGGDPVSLPAPPGTPFGYPHAFLDWTPDGRVIFHRTLPGCTSQLFSANRDGADRRQLTSGFMDEAASVLPDGRIVFSRIAMRPDQGGCSPVDGLPMRASVMIANGDGSGVTELRNTRPLRGSTRTPLTVSPDGRFVLYIDGSPDEWRLAEIAGPSDQLVEAFTGAWNLQWSKQGPVPVRAPSLAIAVTPSGNGYFILDSVGGIFTFGDARFFGSVPALRQQDPGIGSSRGLTVVTTPSGNGYYVLDEIGGIFTFGDAKFLGSLPQLRAQGANVGSSQVLDLALTPSGNGYWVLDRAGGIFAFGDAVFFGSVPQLRQAGVPIGPANVVSLVSTPSGNGYWLLDSVGGLFAFGDAQFFGSVPALRQAGITVGPGSVVDMLASPSGNGYLMLDQFGGVFAFGDGQFAGSVPALRQQNPSIGQAGTIAMAGTRTGKGYFILDDVGGIFTFGDARFVGSVPGLG